MMSLCPHSGTLRWHTHTHSIYCIYKDPQMWNLEGLPLLVQFAFSKMLVLNSFWGFVAHNRRFKRENNLHTQNWMVENDEPLPTLWYTKMAHTHTAYTAIYCIYIYTPNCGICKGCFFGSIIPFKNARFEQFLGIRGS